MQVLSVAVLIICLLIFTIGVFMVFIDIEKELIKERYSEDMKQLEDLAIKVEEIKEITESWKK